MFTTYSTVYSENFEPNFFVTTHQENTSRAYMCVGVLLMFRADTSTVRLPYLWNKGRCRSLHLRFSRPRVPSVYLLSSFQTFCFDVLRFTPRHLVCEIFKGFKKIIK